MGGRSGRTGTDAIVADRAISEEELEALFLRYQQITPYARILIEFFRSHAVGSVKVSPGEEDIPGSIYATLAIGPVVGSLELCSKSHFDHQSSIPVLDYLKLLVYDCSIDKIPAGGFGYSIESSFRVITLVTGPGYTFDLHPIEGGKIEMELHKPIGLPSEYGSWVLTRVQEITELLSKLNPTDSG